MDNAARPSGQTKTKIDLYQIGKWGAISILGYYLLTEHRAHVFQYLPYLLLLACPLMHFFMHKGHGAHHHQESKEERQ